MLRSIWEVANWHISIDGKCQDASRIGSSSISARIISLASFEKSHIADPPFLFFSSHLKMAPENSLSEKKADYEPSYNLDHAQVSYSRR